MASVPIQGLYEAHLTVRDLDRSIAFYRDVLGLSFAHRIPERHVAFFWMGAARATMLGLWEIHTSPVFIRSHIAFRVALADVERCVAALRWAGLTPRHGETEIDEPVVLTWMAAASVYFDDPDGHSLEYIALLDDPPRPHLGTLPLSAWRRLHA
ncbi:VOC family protein [Elioraea sp.]|uniref:VOC family protein n=1 Tax=Elioraea sp. TaxID=2185103 RepID=UPI003F70F588